MCGPFDLIISWILSNGSYAGLASRVDYSKTFGGVTLKSDAQVGTPLGATENIAALLAGGVDTSLFEGLAPRPSESVGAPLLFYSPSTVYCVISMLLLNSMATTEVSDMVRVVNEAFQYLVVFNLNLRAMYNQVFNLLWLRRRYLDLVGALEKLPPDGSASLELEGVDQ